MERLPALLLIEDDEDLRVALRRYLLREGYAVEIASSGDEAVEALRGGGCYDGIITDLHVPGLHDTAIIGALRALAPRVPIIVVTGALDPAREKKLMNDGAFRCFEKPVDIPVLLDAIRDATIESAKWRVA